MNLKKFHEFIQNIYFINPQGFQIISITCLAVLSLIMYQLISPSRKVQLQLPAQIEEAATFIPEGHSLIPIKLTNQKTLSALIEKFGWVDLYSVKKIDGIFKKNHKIVKKIRILRAPLDPDQFGIIVPSTFVDFILEQGPNYLATINKNQFYKSELVKTNLRTKQIIYGHEL